MQDAASSREIELVQSLRVWALLVHFAGTCFLVWTRNDQVAVTIPPSQIGNYGDIDYTYLSMIGAGIGLLTLRMLLMFLDHAHVSARGCLELFVDCWASFMLAWIVLDGLSWTTYIPIFAFCVAAPAAADICSLLLRLPRKVFVHANPPEPLLKRLYYRFIKHKTKD